MHKFMILGILQGLTEFFPVSSSAHLVIIQHFLGFKEELVFLDVSLHVGTILSLLVFFGKDIWKVLKNGRMIGLIAIVTAVTGIIGLPFHKFFKGFFDNPSLVAVILAFNGLLLLATQWIKKENRQPGLADSFWMGAAQAIAITPGISRSGATISSLLFRKIGLDSAFQFSFLASIPAILGAFLYEAKDVDWKHLGSFRPADLMAGIFCAFLSGILALVLLKKILHRDKFHLFGYYCLAAGLVFFLFLR